MQEACGDPGGGAGGGALQSKKRSSSKTQKVTLTGSRGRWPFWTRDSIRLDGPQARFEVVPKSACLLPAPPRPMPAGPCVC